jgi:hypothetical protein
MALRSRRKGLNRTYDVVVAGAAADVTAQAVANFVLARVRILLEQLADPHNHSWRAEPALQRVVLVECRLNWVQRTAGGSQAFDGRDGRSIGHHRQYGAGFDSLSIDVDGAGAALGRIAADMGPVRSRSSRMRCTKSFRGSTETVRRTPLIVIIIV